MSAVITCADCEKPIEAKQEKALSGEVATVYGDPSGSWVCDVTGDEHRPVEPCLNAGPDCDGRVLYRMPLSGTGRSYPRCDQHWSDRLDVQADSIPDTATPPSWFDPSYAGERWDEDD